MSEPVEGFGYPAYFPEPTTTLSHDVKHLREWTMKAEHTIAALIKEIDRQASEIAQLQDDLRKHLSDRSSGTQ